MGVHRLLLSHRKNNRQSQRQAEVVERDGLVWSVRDDPVKDIKHYLPSGAGGAGTGLLPGTGGAPRSTVGEDNGRSVRLVSTKRYAIQLLWTTNLKEQAGLLGPVFQYEAEAEA